MYLLLLKYLKRETTTAEDRKVIDYLSNDPTGEHMKNYRHMHTLYNGLVIHAEDPDSDKRPGNNEILNVKHKKTKKLTGNMWRWILDAAAVIAIVLVTSLFTRTSTIDKLARSVETISVPPGKNMNYTLQDGTSVRLNAGTEIEIPAIMPRHDRYIRLNKGEIYLDVAKDPRKPFRVETFASSVSVLGTKFNIKADEENGEFDVTLLEGSIMAESKLQKGESYVLKPNDRLTMSNGKFKMSKIGDAESVAGQKENIIDIANTDFEALMNKFEKAYGVKILICRDTMPEVSFTRGKIRISDGVENALKILQITSDFNFEENIANNTITIY